jgi:hypothetical protein
MRLVAVAVLTASLFAQRGDVPVMEPKSAWEPPAAVAAASLAESTKSAPKGMLTHAEETSWRETGHYADSVALARAMEKASPWLKVVTLGRSPQGRDIIAVIASKDRAFTPAAAKRTGKPVILLQSCIHPGEVDGKEAGEMLLRDIALTKRFASWLDQVIIINLPIFNVDGHENWSAYHRINQQGPREMGFRTTAQRLNLNRDFMKADAPEMKAWLRFWSAWLPDFFIDNHVTDGADFQYDVTIDLPQTQEIHPLVAAWVSQRYLPQLNDGMNTDGHVMGPYGFFRGPQNGFIVQTYQPRYSTGYAAIQNRPALLVETHSLKTFRTRSWAHYDIMRRSLEIIVRDPKALLAAVQQADQAVAAWAGSPAPVHLDGKVNTESRPFIFRALKAAPRRSDISGGNVNVYTGEVWDIPTKIFDRVDTTVSARAPKGYYLSAEWPEAIERLELHGIRYQKIDKPLDQEFSTWRLTNPKWNSTPFEGRIMVSFESQPVKERRVLPAGSVYVPLNQRSARVAMNLLEPDAPDALVRWGFFHAIFEQKEYFSDYVFAPIAEEMARRNPALKKQFDEKLTADPAFAGNARARLSWWYERSPYLEHDKGAYPVMRLE